MEVGLGPMGRRDSQGAALALVVGALGAPSCGTSNDCTEKATCPDPGDGGQPDAVTAGDSSVGVDVGTPFDGPTPEGSMLEGSAGCTGVCVDAVPSGWSGPVALFDQNGTAPSCPPSFPTEAYNGMAGLTAPAAVCGCTCPAATGAECGSAGIEFFQDPGCATACDGSLSLNLGQCVITDCTGNPDSV